MKNGFTYQGFSLLEVAIALLLAGLLLGGLLQPLGSFMEQSRRKTTWAQLLTIQETLYAHAMIHGRLPCPDCRTGNSGHCSGGKINDGVEDVHGQGCANVAGNLPWSTLALPRRDAWGNDYSYRVDAIFARPLSTCQDRPPCLCNTMQAAFTLCDEAQLSISDTPNGADNIGRNLPAVVVSHGGNHMAVDQGPGEIDNYEGIPHYPAASRSALQHRSHNRPGRFVWHPPKQRDGITEFDDLLIWLSPFVLKTRMVQAGTLP